MVAVRRRSGPAVRDGRRSASVALHATLIVASLIAIFPIAWVVLSSFKPGVWVQSSELSLVKEPTLENYRYVLTETNFPTWFLNSVIVGGLHDGDRGLHLGHDRVRAVPVQLPRAGASSC